MGIFIQKDVGTLLSQFDLSPDHSAVGLILSVDGNDSTRYGHTARASLPGLPSWEAAAEGYNDFAVAGLDANLSARFGLADELPTLAPEGTADTKPCYFGQALAGEYTPLGSDVDEMLAFKWTASGSGKDGLIRGQIILNAQPSSSGNGTSAELGAVSATQTVYLGLHFIAADVAITVTLNSAGNSGMTSPTPQITAAAQSAPGQQFLSAAGAVTDTWWRVDFTTAGGTFDIIAVVGIQ